MPQPPAEHGGELTEKEILCSTVSLCHISIIMLIIDKQSPVIMALWQLGSLVVVMTQGSGA
jgi:hypothetical protein